MYRTKINAQAVQPFFECCTYCAIVISMLWLDLEYFSRVWLEMLSTLWPDPDFSLDSTLCVCPYFSAKVGAYAQRRILLSYTKSTNTRFTSNIYETEKSQCRYKIHTSQVTPMKRKSTYTNSYSLSFSFCFSLLLILKTKDSPDVQVFAQYCNNCTTAPKCALK